MESFLLVFIPMFFAMDPVGLLPIFAGMTEEFDQQQKKRIIRQSIVTAAIVAISFLLVGQAVFKLLGISMGDFMIAGGVILFCLAMMELMGVVKPKLLHPADIGAVPIGTPLVVGPAVLTMALMMGNQYGLGLTISAVLVNILLVAIIFSLSDKLMGVIGKNGARALSKVLALLLAAIGVMMIRRGVVAILSGTQF